MSRPFPPSDGWAFILQHYNLIQRLAAHHFPGPLAPGLIQADFFQEVLADTATHWPTYDPQRSAPSTWLWWQVRYTHQRVIREHRVPRERWIYEDLMDRADKPAGSWLACRPHGGQSPEDCAAHRERLDAVHANAPDLLLSILTQPSRQKKQPRAEERLRAEGRKALRDAEWLD